MRDGTRVLLWWSLTAALFLQEHRVYANLHKLNEVNVLLPYTPRADDADAKEAHRPASHILRAFPASGCFRWSSSRPEVATVTMLRDPKTEESCSSSDSDDAAEGTQKSDVTNWEPLPAGKCSSVARVTATSASDEKGSAMIVAEDADGNLLRCEVFVAAIHRLDILTTDRKIHVEEKEKIAVQAFDSLGNVFSNLDGLRFRWSPHPSDVLQVVPLGLTIAKRTAAQKRIEDAYVCVVWGGGGGAYILFVVCCLLFGGCCVNLSADLPFLWASPCRASPIILLQT